MAALLAPLIQLRNYQENGLRNIRRLLAQGKKRLLLVAPTGAGKGTIAAAVLASAIGRGRRVIFIVHRREIILDVADRVRAAGIEHVAVLAGDATEPNPAASVVICSIQTLFARKERPPADVVVWDEAHHCTALTYLQVAEAYPDAVHLGLTATPERADGTALGDVFEEMVVCTNSRELMDLGHLTFCDVIAPPGRQKTLSQDPVAAYLEHAAGRRCIIFCKDTHHAGVVAEGLRMKGVAAEALSQDTLPKKRAGVLERLRSGQLLVVTNVYILTEGFDCPPVEVVMLARSVGSAAMFLQTTGRALRPSPETGKARALLIDLCGSVHEHGLPDDARQFSLEGKPISLAPKLAPLATCQTCGAVFRPKPVCPKCGAVRPPPELPVIEERRLARTSAVVSEEEKYQVYLRLIEQQQERGYKDGWVGWRFKEKFGFWPPRKWARHRGTAA